MSAITALRRLARPKEGPSCALCGAAIGEPHDHLVEPSRRRLECACIGCALLFDRDEAHLRMRRVGRDSRSVVLDAEAWNGLGLPVELAFVVSWSAPERAVIATFPSALGPVDHVVGDAWSLLRSRSSVIAKMRDDVEALLVDARSERAWIVPIDRAYALVGRLRESWRGMSGGPDAAAALDAFFAELEGRHA